MAGHSNETAAQSAFMCQFCDHQNVKWKCEDCGIFICNSCKEKVHPRLKSSDKHKVMSIKDIGKSQYHDNEPWYYGKMNRKEAEELLQKHKYMGDGTFLVRESESKKGGFALDFLLNGEPKHFKIDIMDDSGKLKCYSTFAENEILFDKLNDAIQWLKTRSTTSFPIKLPLSKEMI